MICEKIRNGLAADCGNFARKYYQQAVIVNREDILGKRIVVSSVDMEGIYTCRNRVYFNLAEDLKGYRFSLNENAESIFGFFDKTVIEGIPQYSHTVNIVAMGISEETKCALSQLDYGDYFAALQFYDGTVEIFGFEFGLSTQNYTFDPQNGGGGSVLKLQSLSDALEDAIPFIYASTEGTELEDFDNDFQNVIFDENGDFNSDFNNDFNNQ